MSTSRQISIFLCLVLASLAASRPDSGGHVPLPGPGLSYGGIPYGSMSGNVANYFKTASSVPSSSNLQRTSAAEYGPIGRYL